jgi:hypothetical protein
MVKDIQRQDPTCKYPETQDEILTVRDAIEIDELGNKKSWSTIS